MYEKLNKIINDKCNIEVKVQKVIIVKLGCFWFNFEDMQQNEKSSNASEQQEKENKKDLNRKYRNLIIEELKSSPNIFDFKESNQKKSIVYSLRSSLHNDIMILGDFFSMKVKMPLRMQKFKEFQKLRKIKPIEEFCVLSNCSIFATYSEIDDYPTLHFIGQEFRDLMKKQFEKIPKIKIKSQPPIPLHPDIILIFVESKKDLIMPLSFSVKNDVFVLVKGNARNVKETIRSLLNVIHFSIENFATVRRFYNHLDENSREIKKTFDEMTNYYQTLYETSWWRIMKTRKNSIIIKKHLSQLHILNVKHEQFLLYYIEKRKEFLTRISQDPILHVVSEYFSENTKIECEVPKVLISALEHFGGGIFTFSTIKSTIISSLIGALVGAIVGAVLTLILT